MRFNRSCCNTYAPRCKFRCLQVRGALRIATSNKQMSETGSFKRCPKKLSAKCAQLVFLILFCLQTKNTARAATSASGWLLLAPKAISKSELNFDNQALESIPKTDLCNESIAQEQQASRRFINVASFANNHIKVLEADAFVCVAEALKILILRHNKIETISPLAFNQLSSLQVLLLDNNQLTSIPSRQALSPLKSLRHLNLANNKIQRLTSDSFGPENVNLISLNLKGNPLHHLATDALSSLGKLKTLTLSQSELSGQLAPLSGLQELRFYHLDRAKSLYSISSNLCQNSQRLATLVLKSNQLERIPYFVHCQSLLLLDLSHNKIRGAISENFLNQANLIDLYLGHNQIELIEERAFVGLVKLQVLELNNNRLKHIHSTAFSPLKATLYDLNLSNNHQLAALSGKGLDNLVSFKSYGNEQLRELPYLSSAAHLALTYAYHCCDYLPNAVNYHTDQSFGVSLSTQDHSTLAASEAPLMSQFLSSVYAKLKSLFASKAPLSVEEAERSNFSATPQFSETLKAAPNGSGATESAEATQNLTELILWPTALFSGRSGNSEGGAWSDLRAKVGATTLERGRRARRWPRVERKPIKAGRLVGAEKELQEEGDERFELEVRLIDELVWWQVEEIRRLHSVQLPFHRLAFSAHTQRAAEQQQQQQQMGLQPQRASEHLRALLLWPPDEQEEANGNEPAAQTRAPLVIMDDAIEFLVPSDTGNNNIDAKHSPWLQQARKGAEGNLEPRLRRRAKEGNSLIESDESALTKSNQYDKRYNQPESAQTTSEQLQPTKIIRCLPEPSAFLPCQDLFDTWWLRVGIWSVFFLSFTGNILVIVVLGSVKPSSSASALTSIMWLAHSKRHIDVPRFLVINLAFADLLMALYLGLLAFVDVSTLGEFKLYAIKWQYSNGCKLAGFLGVLSSELSVFILAIITLERNYAITNAVHLNRRLSLQKAIVIMLLGYVFALVMAMMPLNGISDYRKFSICLPLDVESNLSSQLYIITLIGINTFSFILLLSCYLRMYCAIRGSQAWNTNDLRIAKRMSILVITDFLCWMPIILVAITYLFGYHLIGTKGLKILTIFILPLNSVANPFLYAITTKKFKRDLDTLILRARSSLAAINHCSTQKFNQCTQANINNQNLGGCNAKSCNSKVFIGYNQQYQHNLIMMNKKRNKKNKSRESRRLQRDQQQAIGGRRNYLLARQQFHPDGLTPNHVTMNKTTCSCRAMDDGELRSPSGESERFKCECVAEDEAEFVRIKRIVHSQPKIVLNSADNESAPIDLISSRCAVHKSRSANIVPTTATATLISNNTISSGTTKMPLLIPTQACNLRACSAGTLQQREQCDLRSPCSIRPLSVGGESRANAIGAFHRPVPPVESARESSSPYTEANQRFSHQSHCSGGSMEAACRTSSSSKFLQVIDQQQQPLQLPSATNRSASACGYRNHEVDSSEARKCENTFRRQVSGSCDTMQHRENCAKNQSSRLSNTNGNRVNGQIKSNTNSRSINRLLFEPIAKAWSSIQISLSSSAAQVAGERQQSQPQQASQRLSPPFNSSSSRSTNDVQGKANTTTTSNASPQRRADCPDEHNEAHLLADMLKMSSPTRHSKHLLKLYERRMSRSCDLISASSSTKSKKKEQYSSPASSSTNDQQATTTTSSGDYDDDQRILLATINRIALKRSVKGRFNQGEAANNSNSTAQFGNFRSKCTRCRSWSPALLSKLEDCIYQIKFKLPSFGNGVGNADVNDQNLETMHECYRAEMSSQSSSSEVEVENLSFEEVGDYPNDEDDEDDGDNQLGLDEENEDGDDEEDKFNERGLLEWSQKRKNILMRHKHHGVYQRFNRSKEVSISMADKRRRLRKQQSSTNSDTMSTRTGATVTTNMSISFDSTTGIPMHNPHQPIQEQDGSCNTSEIVDQPNTPCKSSSDRMH